MAAVCKQASSTRAQGSYSSKNVTGASIFRVGSYLHVRVLLQPRKPTVTS
jgi:hypothetical protein